MSEFALYNIERELRALAQQGNLEVDLVGLLGNAHHKARMKDIMQAYRVQTVYHAAAYKHVPIVEQNIIAGVPRPRSHHTMWIKTAFSAPMF